MTQGCNASPCVPLPDALLLLMVLRRHDVSSRTRRRICASCMHGHEVTREPHDRSLVPRGTDSYDFSYHLRFGKFSAMLTTTGHTVGSFAVCMLKYRVKTTETDKRHVVSFSNVRFSKVPMDFGFHADLHAERHWYLGTRVCTYTMYTAVYNCQCTRTLVCTRVHCVD
jgi:hypothetical protein